MNARARPLVHLVAGEPSGDELGAALMRALRSASPAGLDFAGVGGPAMEREGLASLFPMSDVTLMGIDAVVRALPRVLRRIRETAADVVAKKPDVLVLIDSPDFTHRVARRVRRALPRLPIVDYVSPTVWAWRPGRAKAMRAYVDRVLAVLPFEPAAHERLGGPRCDYVGHPLVERLADLRPSPEEAAARAAEPPLVLVLPGSRRSEVARLLAPFGAALGLLRARIGDFDLALPVAPHVEAMVRAGVSDWPVAPRLLIGAGDKFAAYRRARVALAASGTATLELALAGVPLVGAYKVSPVETLLRFVVTTPHVLLPNLILGRRAIPELMQADCTPQKLAEALAALVPSASPVRAAQVAALAELDARMRVPGGLAPGAAAALAVLEAAGLAH